VKQRIKTLCAGGVLVVLALIGVAAAGPLEDGQAAYLRPDYATAMRLLRPFAEQGNAEAQLTLGQMYDFGEGVPQDHVRAHMWFNLAASGSSDNSAQQRSAVEDRFRIEARRTHAQIAEAVVISQVTRVSR
jgi:Sel1 repeat